MPRVVIKGIRKRTIIYQGKYFHLKMELLIKPNPVQGMNERIIYI
jgi:hypothetical protein